MFGMKKITLSFSKKKEWFFSKCTKASSKEKERSAYGCPSGGLRSVDLQHHTHCLYRWTSTDLSKITWNNVYGYKQFFCSKTGLSHFRRACRFVFDDTCGLYQTAVNWIQHTLPTSRVLLCNSLGTPDLAKLSAIWISRGPWNRKFSAPSSPSSKLEDCVHPPQIGLNLGFFRRKVFLRKGVRPAPVPFPLFLGI